MGSMGVIPQIHAVAIPVPVQGHINPLLYLCRDLASKGMLITFVATDSTSHQLDSFQSANIRIVSLPDTMSANEVSGNIRKLIKSMDAAQGPFEELVEELMQASPPARCIISDLALAWTQDVARKFGIPRVPLFTSSASCALLGFHLQELIDKDYIPTSAFRGENPVVDFIPGLPPMHIKHFMANFKHDDIYDPGFKRRISRYLQLRNDSWVFANTSNELEANAIKAIQKLIPNFVSIGPLVPSAAVRGASQWAEDKSCLQWLDTRPASSVLYASFGSLATLSASQVEEIAHGLEMSNKPFLWVIRPDLAKHLSKEFVKLFMERTKDRGLVVPWAPQVEVLGHPSVGGFLTHCGWNSTLESIYMGVPMLCWPCMADQPLNAFFIVEQLKIGLRLLKEEGEGLVVKEEIRNMVLKLMGPTGIGVRKNVLRLQEAVRNGVKDGGSSYANLDRFIQDMAV